MAKLIKAVFGAGEMSKTCRQWQYDYNTILQFVGLDLPATFEVDLANSKTGQSETVLGDADGCCTIPAQYFIPGTSIFAWAYIVDSNSGFTRCQVEIPISLRAKHTGDPPTPEQQSALDQAIALLNAATENIPNEINAALEAAKESGEFDGTDGTHIWWTTARVLPYGSSGGVATRQLNGVAGVTPAVRDYVFAPEIEQSGEPTTLYVITQTTAVATAFDRLCSIKGANGTSPSVAITEITGGHRIIITDEAHPDGQSFDVMDGAGGGGVTVDDALSGSSTNPVQNKVVKAALDGKGTYSKPASGIPKTDMAEDVQASLSKADTALQQHQSLAAYRTSADQDTIDQQQNAAIAAKYSKPSGGIPKSDLAAAVQTSLGKADDALPASGNAYRTASIPMGHLDSTSTATVMTATIPGITELRDGVCVWLENGVIASASGVTLNINSLGAKPIYNSLSGAVVTTTFVAASTYLFVYNATRVTGGCWDMVYGYDTNTTYTPVKLGFGYATCSTAEATAAKTAALSSYTLTTGGIVAVKFTNAVGNGATLNINSKGAKAIYYKGAAITAGVIKAGDTVTMIYSTYYHVLSIDRDIPSPSVDSTTQEISIIYGDTGSSVDYARADHTHYFDITNAIKKVSALNVPVLLYDGQNGVYMPYGPQGLANAYQSQVKINFALVVPPDYDNYPVLFTTSKFDTTTGELHLTGIVGGVLYEATLLPGADPTGRSSSPVMVGTMTTTNLTLPSAQGVNF